MKKFTKEITVYELVEGFSVEIDRVGEVSEFYMCHQKYGDKMQMFGVFTKDLGKIASEEDVVFNNGVAYMEMYAKHYFDYEAKMAFLGKIVDAEDEDEEDDGVEDECGCPLCRAIRDGSDFSD